jgi:N-acetylmuramoyl-L-alanine amidase
MMPVVPPRRRFLTRAAALPLGLLAGCRGLPMVDRPSANQDQRVRFLVLHFTDGDFEHSLALLTRPSDRPVSAHYLVSRAGDDGRPRPTVFRLVDEGRRAWHAGPSRWQGRNNLNDSSIGIEIVYSPDCRDRDPEHPAEGDAGCRYPDYPADQIAIVQTLCRQILARHPEIDPARVVGHADIQPERKPDPGPRFPWRDFARAGIGAWPDATDLDRWRARLAHRDPDLTLLHEALVAYGYGLDAIGVDDQRSHDVLWAFQTHFLPERRSGTMDAESLAVALALVERFRPGEWRGLVERRSELRAWG